MKKLISVMIALVLVVGIGTAVYAEQMIPSMMVPMMKKMHPDLSNEQIQEMYDACKKNGAEMQQMMMNHSTHQS